MAQYKYMGKIKKSQKYMLVNIKESANFTNCVLNMVK